MNTENATTQKVDSLGKGVGIGITYLLSAVFIFGAVSDKIRNPLLFSSILTIGAILLGGGVMYTIIKKIKSGLIREAVGIALALAFPFLFVGVCTGLFMASGGIQ